MSCYGKGAKEKIRKIRWRRKNEEQKKGNDEGERWKEKNV